jgi:hypothetical protein
MKRRPFLPQGVTFFLVLETAQSGFARRKTLQTVYVIWPAMQELQYIGTPIREQNFP